MSFSVGTIQKGGTIVAQPKIQVTGGGTTGGTTSGTGSAPTVIDKSVIPYIQAQPIVFRGQNLRPGALANVWIDGTQVNQFVQAASILGTNVGVNPNVTTFGEGLYCNTTHGYAEVIEDSSGNTLYINENFVTLNLTPYGPANSNNFLANSYLVNELVYQAGLTGNVYANSFVGRVIYWQSSDGALVIETLSGTVSNVAAAGACILSKSGSTLISNVVSPVMGNKFPVGTQVTSVANVNFKFNTTAYYHTHGLVANVNVNSNTVVVTGNVNSNAVNSILQFVSGQGYGQNAKIISISGTGNNILTLNTSLASSYTGNTYYAIGPCFVNGIGLCPGILWVPEDGGFNFQAGNRLVTINDAGSANSSIASMLATATFAVAGSIAGSSTTTPVVQSTPPISPGANTTVAPSAPTSAQQASNQPINNPAASADPLVQTFFTPKPTTDKQDNGCFATSVDLFFASKPTSSFSQFPVSVYIVETLNGLPTTTILGAATVRWEGVATTDGVTTFPSTSNSATATHFVFPDPVYLAPGQEYGLVVYSESPDYFVWVAQLGQQILNSTRMVSPSPYIGSFFKSQNATAWTPIQNQSLMFNINKAVFSQTPVLLNFNMVPNPDGALMDSILLHSSDLSFPVANISYGVKAYNFVTGLQDTNFFQVFNNKPFSYGGDLSTSTLSSSRRRAIIPGNVNSVIVQAELSTNDPDVSPFLNSERLSFMAITNIIDAGGIQNNNITILTPGNHINANNIVVTIGAPTGDLAVQATANVLANGLSGNSVVAINIINAGAGYVTSPTITISEPSAPSNATAQICGEDQSAGGNGWVRYVTRQITLANGFDAGDIQVFMSAVRPQGTDISVYYKILGSQDNDVFQNKTWVLMEKAADLFSPDQSTPVDLNFNTGTNVLGIPVGTAQYTLNGVQYPIGGTFKNFAIKIVLTANDPTVVPTVLNVRGIAVPAG